jgi:hypothetical protein
MGLFPPTSLSFVAVTEKEKIDDLISSTSFSSTLDHRYICFESEEHKLDMGQIQCASTWSGNELVIFKFVWCKLPKVK